MKYRLILFFAISANISFAQSAKEVLDTYSKEFAKPKYMKFTTKYTLYKGAKSNEVLESYSGKFQKNKQNEVYLKAKTTEVISNKEMNITISNDEKAVFVENAKAFSSGDLDITKILPYFKIAPLQKKESFYFVTLTSTPVSGLPYSKIEITLNKSYELVKQVLYLSTPYNISGNHKMPNYINPRLEILNTNYSYEPISESVFNSESYVKVNGKSVTSKIQSYKIYDKRVK